MKRFYGLKKKEVEDLIKGGFLISTAVVFLYFQKHSSELSKLTVAVSKKIKPIVLKNKVRRQIKNLSYEYCSLWEKHKLLIIVKQKYLENDFQKNKNIILKALEKIIAFKSK